jgi:hypothetical protein
MKVRGLADGEDVAGVEHPDPGGERRRVRKPESSHTQAGGQPQGQHPAARLDRVWPDTGHMRIV